MKTLTWRMTVEEEDGTRTSSVPMKEEILRTQSPEFIRSSILRTVDKLITSGPTQLKIADNTHVFIRNVKKVTVEFL